MSENNIIFSTVVRRKVLFGECDPAGIVYTPRFADFSLEAVHQVFDLWFEGQGILALYLPVLRRLCLDGVQPDAETGHHPRRRQAFRPRGHSGQRRRPDRPPHSALRNQCT